MGSIIKKYKLISILIEPEPNAFLKLTKNYQSFDNITLINKVLIEGKNSIPKSKKFYIVAKSYLKKLS